MGEMTETLNLLPGADRMRGQPACDHALMRRVTNLLGAALATAAVFLAPLGDGTARTPVASAATQSSTPLRQPLSFVENREQTDRRFAYYADWGGSSLFFTTRGVTLALDGWAVEQAFVGARAGAEPHAGRPAPGRVNSFVGRRGEWQTGLELYRTLAYRHVWPGIDVLYTGRDSGLETSFLIKPGADPRAIELAYRGATSLEVTPAGRLEVSTPAGVFFEQRPLAYQRVAGTASRCA